MVESTAPAAAASAAASSSSSSSSSSKSIEALLAARPPSTDRFTYLTLIEEHLAPETLPTLHTVLQDASLAQELGWDLVDMLVPLLPASEACLDDVARLGNPREVILKVLEVLERLRADRYRGSGGVLGAEHGEDGDDEDEDGDEGGEGPDDTEAEKADAQGDKEDAQTAEASTQAFVALLGMLAILHRRLQTKYPSRFLESTLRTILAAYRPDRPAMTTAVLGLVRSLAGRRRPPPPVRRSDSQLSVLAQTTSAKDGGEPGKPDKTDKTEKTDKTDASAIGQVGNDHERSDDTSAVSVPDPEAEDLVAPSEHAVQQRLLQSFVTCVLEAYVNANDVAWAPRLVEYYNPDKLVPGRPTELLNFREDPDKIARDSAASQLVALALDLGLQYSDALVRSVSQGPVRRNPFATSDLASGGVDRIPLSTGGVVCLLAYWVFASEVFKSDAPVPNLRVFPDHYAILATLLGDQAAAQIARTPGTVDALVAIGLWLDHHGLYGDASSATTSAAAAAAAAATATPGDDGFMAYHHLLTLCAVFHPSLVARNAATTLAGAVLHANPDAEDRLKILQDLLENCMFSSLRACAVTWLREEILAATANKSTEKDVERASTASASSLFGGPDAVEQLQYIIFPDLQALRDGIRAAKAAGQTDGSSGGGPDADDDANATALLEFWVQNAPFLLQAANFAYFLFCSERLRSTVVPPGMGPAIEQRYVEPLLQAASRLRALLADGNQGHSHGHGHGHDGKEAGPGAGTLDHIALDLEVLSSRLGSIRLS